MKTFLLVKLIPQKLRIRFSKNVTINKCNTVYNRYFMHELKSENLYFNASELSRIIINVWVLTRTIEFNPAL